MRNEQYIFDTARKKTPPATIKKENGWLRHDVVKKLKGASNIGIELGVAQGVFSKRMMGSGKFQRFYGVDLYGTGQHNTQEYCATLKYVGFDDPRYCLLRMDFDSALNLFEDNYFDFIYVDGFAHTGEEGGKTLIDWIKKLKVGGVFAGDDYHSDWPLVVWAVNDLARQLDVKISVTQGQEDSAYSKYPTWFFRKENNPEELVVDPLLYKLGIREDKRLKKERKSFLVKTKTLIAGAFGLTKRK